MPDSCDPSPSSRKAQLELTKLELEIAHLRRRWWQAPPYVLAALPLLLGVLSVLVAWRSGLLDAKAINLDTKRSNLELQVREFESRRNALARQNDALTAKATALGAELNRLRTSGALAAVRTANLEGEEATLRAAVLTARSNAEAAQLLARLAPINTFLTTLKHPEEVLPPRPLPGTTLLVLREMRENDKLAGDWIGALDKFLQDSDLDPDIRAHVMQVIAFGSGDAGRRQALFEFVRNQIDNTDSDAISRTLISCLSDMEAPTKWSDDEVVAIIRYALAVLEIGDKYGDEVMLEIIDRLGSSHPRLRLDRTDPRLFARLVSICFRRLSPENLPDECEGGEAINPWLESEMSMSILGQFAPPLFLIRVSEIIGNSTTAEATLSAPRCDESQLLGVNEELLWLASEDARARFGRYWKNLPSTTDAEAWRDWQKDHRKMISLWSDGVGTFNLDRRALEDALLAD